MVRIVRWFDSERYFCHVVAIPVTKTRYLFNGVFVDLQIYQVFTEIDILLLILGRSFLDEMVFERCSTVNKCSTKGSSTQWHEQPNTLVVFLQDLLENNMHTFIIVYKQHCIPEHMKHSIRETARTKSPYI